MEKTVTVLKVLGDDSRLNDVLTYFICMSSVLRRNFLRKEAVVIEQAVIEYQRLRFSENSRIVSKHNYLVPISISCGDWSVSIARGFVSNFIRLDVEKEFLSETILSIRSVASPLFKPSQKEKL